MIRKYRPSELLKKLEANTIIIDVAGHFKSIDGMKNSWAVESIKKRLCSSLKLDAKHPETNIPGQFYLGMLENTCPNCGQRLQLKIINDTTIGFTKVCPYKDKLPLQITEINVPTGEIVFCNFFRGPKNWNDPKDKYSSNYNINTLQGRINYAKFYAEKYNQGYGQMGNMSVGVYHQPNGEKIIIGDPYPTDDTDAKNPPDPEYIAACIAGFESLGSISLSVWRWECMDASFIPEDVEVNDTDAITVKVPPGRYKIIHYYDTTPDPENGRLFTYSTIERIVQPPAVK